MATFVGVLAENPVPIDFVPDNIRADLRGVTDEISSILAQYDKTYASAERFAEKIRKEDAVTADAVTKRLEIFKRLKNYIEIRRNCPAQEMQILAWQGAQEMRELIAYFAAEENNFAMQKNLPAPVVLSVKDFGAVGDGETDDAPAFRHAIRAAEKYDGKPVTLKIPAGTYLIKFSDKDWAPEKLRVRNVATSNYCGKASVYPKLSPGHLQIVNMDNFTLQGEPGTLILFADATKLGFRILGCRNFSARIVAIDWAERTSTQGAIVAVEQEPFALIFKPDAGYPAPTETRFMKASARRFTPQNSDGLYGNGTTRLGTVEVLPNGRYRLAPQHFDAKHPVWRQRKVGDRIGIIARWDAMASGEASAMDLRDCRFCTLERVTVYKSPGVAFRTFCNYALKLLHCRIEPTPGSNDMVTTNADGCQTTGPIGPYIANCYFSGMEDDGFNIHSASPEVADLPAADRTAPFASHGGFLISGIDGTMKAFLRPLPKGHPGYTQTLPSDIFTRKMVRNNLTTKQKEASNFFGGRAHLFMARPDRIVLFPGDLAGTVVTNCTFFNIRGMALQITAANVLVENCRIEHMNSYGINISALLPWGMTFNPHNVVVRNTRIRDCSNPSFSLRYRAVKANSFCKPRFINDILIENCEVVHKTWCGIEMRNASDVTVQNCHFTQSSESLGRDPLHGIIVCDNAKDIRIKNNVFEIKNLKEYLPVWVTNQEDKNSISENGSSVKEIR